MQTMSASANMDGLLQLLASFLLSGHTLCTSEQSPEVHVVDITIVTMDDPVSGGKQSHTTDHYVARHLSVEQSW